MPWSHTKISSQTFQVRNSVWIGLTLKLNVNVDHPEKIQIKLWEHIQKYLRMNGNICSLYFYSECVGVAVDWAQATIREPLILYCADSEGGWPHGCFLFNEAVDKWAEDDGQNHTAAEDHHLFLEDRRGKDTETERNIVLVMLPLLWMYQDMGTWGSAITQQMQLQWKTSSNYTSNRI